MCLSESLCRAVKYLCAVLFLTVCVASQVTAGQGQGGGKAWGKGGIRQTNNTAPTISGNPTGTVTAGSTYSFQPTATDADGDQLTFSISNKPSWASFDSISGLLSGKPGSGDAGTYSNIVISVSDGQASASLPAFSVEVQAVNQPPVIGGTPATSVVGGSTYSFQPTATDADGDQLTFSISNKPSWASFDSLSGLLSGTPGSEDLGTYSNIVISVSDGQSSASLPAFSVGVLPSPSGNLALGKPVVASSVEGSLVAIYAVDGDSASRWASAHSDPQWIYVDLGASYAIDEVVLSWETAYGKGYEIQVSADAQSWVTVFTEGNGDGGIDDISFAPVNARYVRVLGVQRATSWGYSLWEIGVYGASSSTGSSGTSSSSTSGGSTTGGSTTGLGTTDSASGSMTLQWTAPATRADGTPLSLSAIDGYHILYGPSAGNYPNRVNVADGTAQSATVTALPPGTYYVVMTTYDVNGLESAYSSMVTKAVK
jgi:hypothetical protein